MAQFYKELRQLRESREISLEEISERTKINIQYLFSIEQGKFHEIETPYLRLFLRAYAEEIGGNSERALEQLDSYLGTNPPTLLNAIDEEVDENNEQEVPKIKFLSDKKIRNDYIIGLVFSIILIFSIIIFQKIFNESSNAIVTKDGPMVQNKILPLFERDLLKNYVLDNSSDEILPLSAPFFIKVKSLNQNAFTFKNDTIESFAHYLNANQEKDLESFVNNSTLIFTSTKGISLFINSFELKQISAYKHPLKLEIKATPPSVAIKRYKPLP